MLVSSVTMGFVSSCDENVQDLLSGQLSFTQSGHISRSRHAAFCHYILVTVDDEKFVPLSPLPTFTHPPFLAATSLLSVSVSLGGLRGVFFLFFFF